MRSISAVCVVFTLALLLTHSPGQNNPHVASTNPLSPADEQKTFRLPPGFEIQLVAAEPDIHKPLNIAFDDRGRLWVTETVEYPFPAPPARKGRDAVKVLEDFGPDGRARKITTFADGLNIPIGILPLHGIKPQDALVFSIPNVYRLRDSKGAGQADQRDVFFSRFDNRDTHGMTNSFLHNFDGWIYATHGFSNNSTVKGADGKTITMSSGNTYRMKPDGSHVEQYTWGQVNPFGFAVDPLGNLYSADCHSRPIYQLLRGGYYPSFGKPHDGLGFAPEIMTHDHGSTAIAGVLYYAADQYPAAFRDNLFIGNVVTNRINRDTLERHGSTVRAIQQPDFVSSTDPWFRPVDLKLGPDGAMYVADFYNRIIGHYEVPLNHPGRDRARGRIWRIVYKGQDSKVQPGVDWTTATIDELVKGLGDANLTVRLIATHQLVERGGAKATEAVQALLKTPAQADSQGQTFQRAQGLWVLQRLSALDDVTLTNACRDRSEVVRVHAQRIVAERSKPGPAVLKAVRESLQDSSPNVQRAAADALGQHPDAANLRPLLDLRHEVPANDTHLLHMVRLALRNQLRVADNWAKLPLKPWSDRDAQAIADVALGVHGLEAAAFLLDHLQRMPANGEQLTRTVHHIARFGAPPVVQKLLAFAQHYQANQPAVQAGLYRAVERGTQERGAPLPDAARTWGVNLTDRLLASPQAGELQLGIELAGSLKTESQLARVIQLALARTTPEPQRNAALTTLAASDIVRYAVALGDVLKDAEAPIGLREHAANLLGRANQAVPLSQLLQALPAVPARLQTVIAAGLAGTRQGAEKLLEAVAAGKASARLLQERAVEVKLNNAGVPNLKERIGKLTLGLPPADQRVQELLNRRRDSYRRAQTDVALGARVFEKHCANCHQVSNKGARIGPQLDGIGIRGLDRILEDTLDPNRNVDQAFRTTLLTLKNGQTFAGLLLKEEGEVLVLADNMGKEVRHAKSAVEERFTSQMSPMPATLADQIPEADFNHLLAYLLSQRVAPPDKKDGK